MLKYLFPLLLPLCSAAQELYVFTEPASNMPTGSTGIRVTNTLAKQKFEPGYNYHLLPELMIGVSKNLMLHADAYLSNRVNGFNAEGFGVYGKYRFLSNDAVHSHYRMAAFGRVSYNTSDIHQQEIEINGHNSGFETGIIATQLLHKVALSSTVSYEQAMNNNGNKFPADQSTNAINYSFSFGKLMLPGTYRDYRQTNMNFMTELLAQTLVQNGRSYLDIAPSLQFIFNSQARLDIGYRRQLYSSMYRTAPDVFLLRMEYLFFQQGKSH